jgi:hypothetical protein
MYKFESGILLIAYNNSKIDYAKIAAFASLAAKKSMANNHVTLMTDTFTLDYMKMSMSPELIASSFDHIIVEQLDHETNTRTHHDSPWVEFTTQFSNKNKHTIFEKSPYRKTLMIDVDYFIGNNTLDIMFDTDVPLAMYKRAVSVANYDPRIWEQKLHPDGIDMWWSTVVYWNADSEEAKLFFGIWEHVKENYDYYKWLYKFPGSLYRTDYAASIAVHLLNGQIKSNFIDQLPGHVMRYSDQIDDIVQFKGINDVTFLCPDPDKPWETICSRIKNENVHIMNKAAIIRHHDRLLEVLK